jgi:hypothetical protein
MLAEWFLLPITDGEGCAVCILPLLDLEVKVQMWQAVFVKSLYICTLSSTDYEWKYLPLWAAGNEDGTQVYSLRWSLRSCSGPVVHCLRLRREGPCRLFLTQCLSDKLSPSLSLVLRRRASTIVKLPTLLIRSAFL